jgi:Transposase IS66 family
MWVSAIVVPSARDSASTLASRPRSIDAAYKPCVGCRLCALEVVDGYAGFERLTERGDIVLAACWAHTRRKFFDVHEATGSPIAAEALRRIAELYAIEKSIMVSAAPDARTSFGLTGIRTESLPLAVANSRQLKHLFRTASGQQAIWLVP